MGVGYMNRMCSMARYDMDVVMGVGLLMMMVWIVVLLMMDMRWRRRGR